MPNAPGGRTTTRSAVDADASRPDSGVSSLPELRFPLGQPGTLVRRLGHRHVERIPLEPLERRAVIAALFFEGSRRRPFLRRFTVLMALSVSVASLGLLANSVAVVIGAMLVAPLMGPLLATSAGLVMGWPRRIRFNLALAALAGLGAVALAAFFGVIGRPELEPIPDEVLARTSPNFLDLGIAAAAGAAGAYGHLRKQASESLAGAAVAVALVPPLATVGLTLTVGEFRLAAGAGLLFLINFCGVVASGAATFLVGGLPPGQRLLSTASRIQKGLRWAAIGTIIIALPLHFGPDRLLPIKLDDKAIEAVVEEWGVASGHLVETVDVGVSYDGGVANILLVVATPEDPPLQELGERIADEIDQETVVDIHVVATERSLVRVDQPR